MGRGVRGTDRAAARAALADAPRGGVTDGGATRTRQRQAPPPQERQLAVKVEHGMQSVPWEYIVYRRLERRIAARQRRRQMERATLTCTSGGALEPPEYASDAASDGDGSESDESDDGMRHAGAAEHAAAGRLAAPANGAPVGALATLTPRIDELHLFEDGCALLMGRGRLGTIQHIVNAHKLRANAASSVVATCPELLAMHLTVQMLRCIDQLHRCDILHADIKPDNWLLVDDDDDENDGAGDKDGDGDDGAGGEANVEATRRPAPTAPPTAAMRSSDPAPPRLRVLLCDFGQSIDLRAYPRGTRLTGRDCAASGFECVAMRECRPWRWSVDTFGVCSTAHALLFGTYLHPVQFNVHAALSATGGDAHGSGDGAASSAASSAQQDGLPRDGATRAPRCVMRWRPRERLKRYWAAPLWERFFDVLLNDPDGAPDDGPDGRRGGGGGGRRPPLGELIAAFEEHLAAPARRHELRAQATREANQLREMLRGRAGPGGPGFSTS